MDILEEHYKRGMLTPEEAIAYRKRWTETTIREGALYGYFDGIKYKIPDNVVDPRTHCQVCHSKYIITKSPVLNSNWYDCKKCNKTKEEIDKEKGHD